MGIDQIRALKKNADLPKVQKRYSIPKVSAKRAAKNAAEKNDRNGEDTELQKWYAKIMQQETGKCWESGEKINKQDKIAWHGSIAHVLPKYLFPSTATHPQNYMILSMYGGGAHGQYDSSWENASKMKVWPYACKIFNILYPLLTREEKAKLPDIVIQEISPKIYNK